MLYRLDQHPVLQADLASEQPLCWAPPADPALVNVGSDWYSPKLYRLAYGPL